MTAEQSCIFNVRGIGCSQGLTAGPACATCAKYRGLDRGLGDSIARLLRRPLIGDISIAGVAHALGCNCEERRAKLNAIIPFSR